MSTRQIALFSAWGGCFTRADLRDLTRERSDQDCRDAYDSLDLVLSGDDVSRLNRAAMDGRIDEYIRWVEQLIERHGLTDQHYELVLLAAEHARRESGRI